MDIEVTTSTWMLIFFIFFMIISISKIWAFLPNKKLADDDTTQEATQALEILMLKIVVQTQGKIDEKELFLQMSKDEDFDSKLFWRFNLNRLKHLLKSYYAKNPDTTDIKSIYLYLNK